MIIEGYLREVIRLDPDAPAVETRGHWTSWGQLAELMHAVEARLDEVGLARGARVGVLLRNRVPALAALLACVVSGRCAVSFNPLLPASRLAADISGQAPRVLIGAEAEIDSPEVIAAAAQAKTRLLSLPVEPLGAVVWASGSAPSPAAEELWPEVLMEMLTSGTTGPPKRRPLLRSSLDEAFSQGLKYERGRKEGAALRSGVRLVSSPLTHISGLFGSLSTLADGRKLALLEKFNVAEWTAAIERHQCRVANLPPTALRMVLDADVPKASLVTLLALRTGTAPLKPEIVDAFLDRYDLPVLNQYGATEFAGSIAGWSVQDFRRLWRAKRGSVGRIHANVEARIIDPETGETLPAGEVGILELRSPQLGDAVSWTCTTDRASLDADNFLWIHGRTDNAIIRGGFKIQPDDIARAIESHPAVREAVVVGLADRRVGEVPVAAIVLEPETPAPTEDELRSYLGKALLPYEIPTQFRSVAELPRTPSMKPSTPEIKRLFDPASAPQEATSDKRALQ
jgi:acyl-CoA synthetase (AMP-forming)/AMP-acid ligase II